MSADEKRLITERLLLDQIAMNVVNVPSVFTVAPHEGKRFTPHNIWSLPVKITLWCTHPGSFHPVPETSYKTIQPKEWFLTVLPHLKTTLKLLKYVTPAARGLLSYFVGQPESALHVENMERLCAAAERELKSVRDLHITGSDFAASRFSVESPADRAVKRLLLKVGEETSFNPLYRVLTTGGKIIWVCPHHYEQFYQKDTRPLDDQDAVAPSDVKHDTPTNNVSQIPAVVADNREILKRGMEGDLTAIHYIVKKVKEFSQNDDKASAINFILPMLPQMGDEIVFDLYQSMDLNLQQLVIPHLSVSQRARVKNALRDELLSIGEDNRLWSRSDFESVKEALKRNDKTAMSRVFVRLESLNQDWFEYLSKDELDTCIEHIHCLACHVPENSIREFLERWPIHVKDLLLNELLHLLRNPRNASEFEARALYDKLNQMDMDAVRLTTGILEKEYNEKTIDQNSRKLVQSLAMLNDMLSSRAFIFLISNSTAKVRNEIYGIILWAPVKMIGGFGRVTKS